ncbi:MAG: hypothetical protein U5Q44_04880 [Dehalococcoidia bacterium]|nr:hypothetical protein [Dehalococcoidia bacterium]
MANEGTKTLKSREFLFYTEDLAMAGLPEAFPRPERRVMWTILQMYYGTPDLHFELQPQGARKQVELGLHFEADVETNEARAVSVARYAPEILGELGPEWEMEEWTASWRRLHRVFAYERLTAGLGREVAEQMTLLLVTLQPLIEEAEAIRPVEAPASAPAPSRGSRARYRGRAGARR